MRNSQQISIVGLIKSLLSSSPLKVGWACFFSHPGPRLFSIFGSSTKALSISQRDLAITVGFNHTHWKSETISTVEISAVNESQKVKENLSFKVSWRVKSRLGNSCMYVCWPWCWYASPCKAEITFIVRKSSFKHHIEVEKHWWVVLIIWKAGNHVILRKKKKLDMMLILLLDMLLYL